MLTQLQRKLLREHPNVTRVQEKRKPTAHDPHLDAIVWTDGYDDMPHFCGLFGLVIVHEYRKVATDADSKVYHVLKAPTGSVVLHWATLVGLVSAEILDLRREDDRPMSVNDLAQGNEAIVRSTSGNQYKARRIGQDRYLLEAIEIVYRIEGARHDQ